MNNNSTLTAGVRRFFTALTVLLFLFAFNASAQTEITMFTTNLGSPSVGTDPNSNGGIHACSPYGISVYSGTGGKK